MIETPTSSHRKHVDFVGMKFRAWEDIQSELLEIKLCEFWGIPEEAIQEIKDVRESERQEKEKKMEISLAENTFYYHEVEANLSNRISNKFFEQVWELKLGSISYSEKDKTFGSNGIRCEIMESCNGLFTEGSFHFRHRTGGGGHTFDPLNSYTAFETLEEAKEESLKNCIATQERHFENAPEDIKLGKLIQHLQSLLNTIKGGVVKEASGQLSFF